MTGDQGQPKSFSYQQYRDSMNPDVGSAESAETIVIEGAQIIDGLGNAPVPDGTVLIKGARVAAAGPRASVQVPPGATVIDGRGCTALPGLIDVHVHDFSDANMALYVRNGVTSIRLAGGHQPSHRALRARVERGDLVSPRVFTCGYMLDATPHAWPGNSYAVDSPAEARRVVRRAVTEEAVDAIIATTLITRPVLEAIVETAHALGVPVTGQIWRCSARDAVETGMDGLDNTSRIPESTAYPRDRLLAYRSVSERLAMLASLWTAASRAQLDEIGLRMAERGLTFAPEIVSFEAMAGTGDRDLYADRDWPGHDDLRAKQYDWKNAFIRSAWTAEELTTQERAVERIKEFSLLFHKAGGALAGGTDLGFGGILMHRELRHFVDAGLTSLEAIRALTRQAASFLARDDLGHLMPGATADVVVVRGDPNTDPAALRNVEHVLIGGREAFSARDDRPGSSPRAPRSVGAGSSGSTSAAGSA